MSKVTKKPVISGVVVEGEVITSGTITCTFDVSRDAEAKELGEQVSVALSISLAGLTITELLTGWFSSARIRHQSVLRQLSNQELEEYSGADIMWSELGKKIASRMDKVNSMKSQFGLDQKTAEWAADHPELFQQKLASAMAAISTAGEEV